MTKRKFLASLLFLPALAGCVHWPGIDNKKRKAVEMPRRVCDIYWTQSRAARWYSPAYKEEMERILTQCNGSL